MISPKRLVKIARKWQRVAAMRRKRISFPRLDGDEEVIAHRGHFIVYSIDGKRFMFPIRYLNNCVIRELLQLSEDEFGLPSSGPITLPCDAMFMDYMVSLIQRRANAEIEKALLMSITANTCSLSHSLQQNQTGQQLLVCSH
ncbi:auxin-responsive protein SAUR67 [Eucalyptus grandis]|nr:auxin-responsive protein SAUR67 [Eucalyptus grandis]